MSGAVQGEMLRSALAYIPRTIPLLGKVPAVGAGWPEWEATEQTVRDHFERHPDHNVGIRCGNGLSVLDVDTWDSGGETIAALEAEHGKLPLTATVVTGNNGRHLYFRAPVGLRSRNLRAIGLAGLEIKAAGTQVCAPPSIHAPTEREYVWVRPLVESEIAELPDWLAELAGERRPPATSARAIDASDTLLMLPATTYVPLLTGRELNAAGKCICPFHHETEPSLQAYPASRGWACFGCQRGGTIVDLGAHLWGISPRGRGYWDLRRRLTDELLVTTARP